MHREESHMHRSRTTLALSPVLGSPLAVPAPSHAAGTVAEKVM